MTLYELIKKRLIGSYYRGHLISEVGDFSVTSYTDCNGYGGYWDDEFSIEIKCLVPDKRTKTGFRVRTFNVSDYDSELESGK